MSKAYGLAGLRVGWIACQDRGALQAMGSLKHYLSICNSAPSELLALIALRCREKILARNHRLMEANLALWDRFFKTFGSLFEWVRPRGGCIGYPLFKGRGSVDQFVDALRKECGVLLLPGSVYGEESNFFRISFGRANCPEGIERLSRFIKNGSAAL